jgi:hypothetical protein
VGSDDGFGEEGHAKAPPGKLGDHVRIAGLEADAGLEAHAQARVVQGRTQAGAAGQADDRPVADGVQADVRPAGERVGRAHGDGQGLVDDHLGRYAGQRRGVQGDQRHVDAAGPLAVLPASPPRPVRVDAAGAVLLGLGIAGLLLVLTEGPAWGWASAVTVGSGIVSVALLAGWAGWELRARWPLIDLRLLRRRPVVAANVTAFLVAVGFYPLAPLVVRFVQTPAAAGYGFGASVLVAALMLTPFSLASFAASSAVRRLSRRVSAEVVVVLGCVTLIASMVLFLLARDAYWQIVTAMALDGFGVGCVYAVNPLQITSSVPAAETGSAMSFYQLARTVAYSIASALSATLLVLSIHRGHRLPTGAGYSAAALTSTVILAAALVAALLFALPAAVTARRPSGAGRVRRAGG